MHPHKYDMTSKDIFKNSEAALVKLLTGKTIHSSITYLDVEFQQISAKRADLIFQAEDEIFHIEFQSANHPKMIHRMLNYANEIMRTYNKPPYQFLIYTGNRVLNMINDVNFQYSKNSRLDYGYEIVNFSEMEIETILALNSIDILPILVLSKPVGLNKKAHLKTILNIIIERTKGCDIDSRKNLILKTEILAGINYSESVIYNIFEEIIKMLDIKQSSTYQRILKEGLKEGIEQGIEQGILKVLHARFQQIPEHIQQNISQIKDRTILDQLLIKAATCQNIAEFIEELKSLATE